MAKVIRHLNDDQKSFVKIFDSLCYAKSRWEVWSDFVHMTARAISNSVDVSRREEREEQYMNIAKRYSSDQMESMSALLAATVMALEANPDQDFLGQMYMSLNLGNDHKGQFFTPYHICHMMAEINVVDPDCPKDMLAEQIKKDGYISVCDPCIGGGAMLIAFANVCRSKNIDYQNSVIFVGQDIDPTCAMMAYIQLSLLGCPGYICIGNSLTQPMTGGVPLFPPYGSVDDIYVMPMFFSWVWEGRRQMRVLDAKMRSVAVEVPNVLPQPVTMKPSAEPTVEPLVGKEFAPEQLSLF